MLNYETPLEAVRCTPTETAGHSRNLRFLFLTSKVSFHIKDASNKDCDVETMHESGIRVFTFTGFESYVL